MKNMKKIILTIIAIIVAGGIGGYFVFKKPAPPSPPMETVVKCGDNVCDEFEKANPNACPVDCVVKNTDEEKPESNDYSLDADGVLWGTETYLTILENPNDKKEINTINNILKVKNVKFRIDWIRKTFSNIVCLPSQTDCQKRYDLDKFAKIFKENNWSMKPMFSPSDKGKGTAFTDSDIDDYVNYVDWFVTRYKKDANIKYIELINTPVEFLYEGTMIGPRGKMTLEQLVKIQNKVYDRIKTKYPDIMVGTHGFEYQFDGENLGFSLQVANEAKQMVEYFLDKSNDAKFDYWAFHGYATYPSPIQTSTNNKYSGILGILEIRKRLDANGWQNRLIIDTEHVPSAAPKLPDDLDKSDAALTLQELIIKRTLKYNNKLVLSGIMPLKIIARGNVGEHFWGSLKEDGSSSRTIKATALLLSKLNEYNYASRLSGEFDNQDHVWVEKFQSGSNKELYIFFKPLSIPKAGAKPALDSQSLNYNLDLNKKPISAILTDINGNKTNLTPSQTITLKAVNSPKFLEIYY